MLKIFQSIKEWFKSPYVKACWIMGAVIVVLVVVIALMGKYLRG